MRKECNGVSYIPLVGKPLKFLPQSVHNKFCKLGTFLVGLEIPHRNPHQNNLHLEQDTPK